MRSLVPIRLAAMMLAVALAGVLPAHAQVLTFDFMPKGGKSLFIDVFGAKPDQATIAEITGASRSEADWTEALKARKTDLKDKPLRTLASYLAVNMPLAKDAVDAAVKAGDITPALPPDGRELAWHTCQTCHSFLAGYLSQDRDLEGWRNAFRSPFHRELPLTEKERDEFAHYSVINMPMKFEDVPEDLRF
jgi:hypothetical protein